MLQLFSWDEAKNRSNQTKHGVGFDTARLVFDDPLHVSSRERIEHGELRWQTIGLVGAGVLLLVVHTWDHIAADGQELIRIISARHATKLERRIYEKGF
ncbi:MAG: BrnT family toxin [Pseudomonadota bacterium]